MCTFGRICKHALVYTRKQIPVYARSHLWDGRVRVGEATAAEETTGVLRVGVGGQRLLVLMRSFVKVWCSTAGGDSKDANMVTSKDKP